MGTILLVSMSAWQSFTFTRGHADAPVFNRGTYRGTFCLMEGEDIIRVSFHLKEVEDIIIGCSLY